MLDVLERGDGDEAGDVPDLGLVWQVVGAWEGDVDWFAADDVQSLARNLLVQEQDCWCGVGWIGRHRRRTVGPAVHEAVEACGDVGGVGAVSVDDVADLTGQVEERFRRGFHARFQLCSQCGREAFECDALHAANGAEVVEGFCHVVAEVALVRTCAGVPACGGVGCELGVGEVDGEVVKAVALGEDGGELREQIHVTDPRFSQDVGLKDVVAMDGYGDEGDLL